MSATRSPREVQRDCRQRSLPGLQSFQIETRSPNGSSTFPPTAITAFLWTHLDEGEQVGLASAPCCSQVCVALEQTLNKAPA